MRHRNKLLFVFLVFLFAALFVTGIAVSGSHWQYAGIIKNTGQIGLAICILLYFLVPDMPRKEDDRN